MMNRRHPTQAERDQIRFLVDKVGAVEIIRLVGQMIANDHPAASEGVRFRSEINRIAKMLDGQAAAPEQDTDRSEMDRFL